MGWFISVVKNFSFKGRARRKEYWMFVLFTVLVTALLMFADERLDFFSENNDPDILTLIFLLMIVIQALAVSVRRMHDTGRTGWWLLIQFVPYIGTVIWFVLSVLNGKEGENRYGPDPKQT